MRGDVVRRRRECLLRLTRWMERQHGETDLARLEARYARWLERNRHLLTDAHSVARADVEALDQQRKARFRPQQLSLFDPDAWLVLGEGQRVLMGRASQLQCLAAMQNRSQSHLIEAQDFVRDIAYWNARIAAFTPADADLTDVERRAFGWTG